MEGDGNSQKPNSIFTRYPEIMALGVVIAVSFILRFVLLPLACAVLLAMVYFDLRAVLPTALACGLIGLVWFSKGEKAFRAIYISIALLLTVPIQLCGWGQIKPGGFADIIAVDGDPARDFKAIGRIKFLMEDGTIYVGDR
jgi:hypothetical protein